MDKAVQSYKYIKQNTIIEKLEEMLLWEFQKE